MKVTINEVEYEVTTGMADIMYSITKEAARSDFMELIEYSGSSEEDWDSLREILRGIGLKTYL
jgi:hypothetical protein